MGTVDAKDVSDHVVSHLRRWTGIPRLPEQSGVRGRPVEMGRRDNRSGADSATVTYGTAILRSSWSQARSEHRPAWVRGISPHP
jgi:hypothetical protein